MKVILAITVLVLAMLACGQPAPEYVLRGWTVTPSVVADAVEPTQTPYIVQETVVVEQVITNTPEPTGEPVLLCVSATKAVHLRPSPSDQNYPITALPNGSRLTDLGGKDGKWLFVQFRDLQGWVHGDYVKECV